MAEKTPHIATALRRARRRAGFSQRDLAAAANVSRPTIAALELGRQENIQSSTLLKLAEALKISPSELMAPVDADAVRAFEEFVASPLAKMLKLSSREKEFLMSLQNTWHLGSPSHETFYHLVEAIRHTRERDR